MFGNLIDGSQNAVWCLAPEGEIPQNYENLSSGMIVFLSRSFSFYIQDENIEFYAPATSPMVPEIVVSAVHLFF